MQDLIRFSLSNLPQIEFGQGVAKLAPALAKQYGNRALLVTGAKSIEQTEFWPELLQQLQQHTIQYERVKITHEPSPQLVDEIVKNYVDANINVVIGLGGGSVLDAGKAIAGLLPHGNSVMDHLEGVGPELPYQGPPLPYIAMPTTAGTGSEATKNAVLSIQSKKGFKKSFRDKQLVPTYALVDPELLTSCPKALIAANGMDAITQLIESYVSLKTNAITQALAWDGLKAAKSGLLNWYLQTGEQNQARQNMAYASLMSGICLAQTGLGSVHGLASPLGAYFPIPHGVVCGTLLAVATEINIQAMLEREPNNPALSKYSQLGRLFCDNKALSEQEALLALPSLLHEWTKTLELPRLSEFQITRSDYPLIIANSRGSSMTTNPIVLSDLELETLLNKCL